MMMRQAWVTSVRYMIEGRPTHAAIALSLALGLSVIACEFADAASIHRSKLGHVHGPHAIASPRQGAAPQGQFAVPGWSDDATRRWLDGASSAWTQA
jgi:hypothetical protein